MGFVGHVIRNAFLECRYISPFVVVTTRVIIIVVIVDVSIVDHTRSVYDCGHTTVVIKNSLLKQQHVLFTQIKSARIHNNNCALWLKQ